MKDAIVVGCGVIGATVAAVLQGQGLDVLVLDDNRPMSGTAPSGGHLKPSWFGDMKATEYEPAMELLNDVWGLQEESFLVRPSAGLIHTTVYRVDTDQVRRFPRTQATVSGFAHLQNFPVVYWGDTEERCRLLVVATGVWAAELLKGIDVTAKQGVSFRLKGVLKEPFIKPWAPYKQIVAHQQGEVEIWIGDGAAILPKNWTAERTQQCRDRCQSSLPTLLPVLREIHGYRPYCSSGTDPCLLRQLGPRAWLATGAGKLGTIAAGWVARKMLNRAE